MSAVANPILPNKATRQRQRQRAKRLRRRMKLSKHTPLKFVDPLMLRNEAAAIATLQAVMYVTTIKPLPTTTLTSTTTTTTTTMENKANKQEEEIKYVASLENLCDEKNTGTQIDETDDTVIIPFKHQLVNGRFIKFMLRMDKECLIQKAIHTAIHTYETSQNMALTDFSTIDIVFAAPMPKGSDVVPPGFSVMTTDTYTSDDDDNDNDGEEEDDKVKHV